MLDLTVPKYQMDFNGEQRLGVFADQFQFFSISLPYIYARFSDQQLFDFLASTKYSVHFAYRFFNKPIFTGMAVRGDPSWNHVLWGVEKTAYPDFENFMLSVTLTDNEKKMVFRMGVVDLLIPDPLLLENTAELINPADVSLIAITAFGVDGSDRAIRVHQKGDANLALPAVQFLPPQPRTVLFAKTYFAGDNASAVLGLPPPASSLKPLTVRAAEARDAAMIGKSLQDYKDVMK